MTPKYVYCVVVAMLKRESVSLCFGCRLPLVTYCIERIQHLFSTAFILRHEIKSTLQRTHPCCSSNSGMTAISSANSDISTVRGNKACDVMYI